jgi:transcription elongation factor Elf1
MIPMDTSCPKCGSGDVSGVVAGTTAEVICNDCGHRGTVRYEGGNG